MRTRFLDIWQLLLGAYRALLRDNGPLTAGALAFYSALALLPLALLATTVFGYILGSSEARVTIQAWVQELLPGTNSEVLTALQHYTVSAGPYANLIGAVGFLWAASNLFVVLSHLLTTIWVGAAQRGFWARRLIGFLAVFGGGLLFLANTLLSSLLGALRSHLPSLHVFEGTLPWLLNALLVGSIFFLLYRFLPRGRVVNRAALVGAFSATVLWLFSRYLFALLVTGSSHYGQIYGPLAGAVVLLLWIYYSAYILLFCAELGVKVQTRYWPEEER